MIKSSYKKVNRVGFKKQFKSLIDVDPPDPFRFTQRDFVSRSVLSKLFRTKDRTNKREFTLKTVQYEKKDRDTSDEEQANTKRTGLPQIKKFYQKNRELSNRIQREEHKK